MELTSFVQAFEKEIFNASKLLSMNVGIQWRDDQFA